MGDDNLTLLRDLRHAADTEQDPDKRAYYTNALRQLEGNPETGDVPPINRREIEDLFVNTPSAPAPKPRLTVDLGAPLTLPQAPGSRPNFPGFRTMLPASAARGVANPRAGQAPAPPPAAEGATAAAPSNIPGPGAAPSGGEGMPSMYEQVTSMRLQPSRGAVRAAGARRQSANAAFQEAQKQAEASRQAVHGDMEERARAAEAAGVEQAIGIASAEDEYAAQKRDYDERAALAKQEYDRRTRAFEDASNEFRAEAQKEKPNALLGGSVMAAIAIGLGGFASSRRGGPNQAMQVIQARVQHEADIRARKMAAGARQLDALDKLVWRAYNDTQSVEAARKVGEAELFNQVGLRAERLAALNASAEKAANFRTLNAELKQRETEAREGVAAENKRLADRALAGPSFKQRLGFAEQAARIDKMRADTAKQEMETAAGPFKDKDEMFASTMKRMEDIDKSDATLKQFDSYLAALEKSGHTQMPGSETLMNSGLIRGRREFLARTGFGPSTTGMTQEEGIVAGGAATAAHAAYFADTGHVANQAHEDKQAREAFSVNGSIADVRANIRHKRELLQAQRDGIAQTKNDRFRAEFADRLARPADLPPLQTVTPTQPTAAPPFAGASRIGGGN